MTTDQTMKQALEALRNCRCETLATEAGRRAAIAAIEQHNLVATKRTGWPEGLLQDDSSALSKCLANKPGARLNAREAGEAIKQNKPVVRMLTDGEIADALSGYGMMAKQIQRKFAEVNGLTIGEQG